MTMIDRVAFDPWRVRTFPADMSLRLVSSEVTEFSPTLDRMIEQMGRVMHEQGGIGLAAPQVGWHQRVIVVHEEAVRQAKGNKPKRQGQLSCFGFVNPRIVERTEETELSQEGCLSLPGISAKVERSVGVIVEHETTRGETFRVQAIGALAAVFQHEIDHLDGKLVLDHLTPKESRYGVLALSEMAERQKEAREAQVEAHRQAVLQQAHGLLVAGG